MVLTFQVTNTDFDSPLEVRSRLLKFEADTTAARPMNFNNYSPSTLPYIGVDMRRPETIDETVRRLDQPGSVLIDFKYELPERGNYRFEGETTDQQGNKNCKARKFDVISAH